MKHLSGRGALGCWLVVWLCLGQIARGQAPLAAPAPAPVAEAVTLPPSVPDPLEPLNRAVWALNKGLMIGVIKPTSRVYRLVVAKPLREGISNFGKNLKYPGRLINNLLQGKWTGARDESYRFLVNTTAGVAGFVDVATRWKMPKSDEDFGQTFGYWGWQPHCFLMLPLIGPSNERDALGAGADTAANPLIYVSPYRFDADNPLTYLGPYTYFDYSVRYNDLSDTVREYTRLSRAEMDSYATVQYAWTFARATKVADFQVTGPPEQSSLETLESIFFTLKDPGFPDRGWTRSVLIPATGRQLKFTFWLRPGKAPVVYIVPGLGSHRLAQPALALAELAWRRGYSVVTVSSPFHAEFMENAATADMPANLAVDGHDLHVALTEMDQRLRALYPDRLGATALLGYSMGALETLFIAAAQPTNQTPLIQFDRHVAIHTPVRMLHGVAKLDEYYRAPLEWPGAERDARLENTFLKVAALSQGNLTPQTTLPFNGIESRFLVGATFRLILRDIIYSSQRRNNQHILREPITNSRREAVYREILRYSYQDYFQKFAVPYYQSRGLAAPVPQTLDQAGDLHTYEAGLRGNSKVRVIVNQNDFLLTPEDLAWLQATFPPEQLTVFPQGGHLGNLAHPEVQKSILEALEGLPPVSTEAR